MGILDFFRRSKPKPSRKRSYSAAANIARYGDLSSSSGSADYELVKGLSQVRGKARFLARNSSSMKRFLQLMRVNIVGPEGFKLQSRVRKNDGSVDATLNTNVENAWRKWFDSPTVDGQMGGVDLLEQMSDTWCRDGEVIWEIVYGKEYVDGISINPVEADLLDEALNTVNVSTGNDIRMGVEVNRYGRPVAYHLLTQHPGDMTWYSSENRNRYRRIPADRIIHIFQRTRPGQTRGEPPSSSIIQPVKMLDGYREAETMSRRLRAALMGFFTRTLPKAEQIDELATGEDEADEIFEMEMEPGRLRQLPDGMDFKEFAPGGSVTDYDAFEGQIKKDTAMGFGISVMSHGMELEGISYSSGRTVTMEDRNYYKSMQMFFIRNGINKVAKLWLKMHILSKDSNIMPSKMDKILEKLVFRPRGWDWVDPAKDVKANTEALRTNQTSLARIAASRGIDRDDLLDEIQEDQLAASLRGLTLDYSDGKSGIGGDNDDGNAQQ